MKKNLTELVFILDRSGSMSGLEKGQCQELCAKIELVSNRKYCYWGHRPLDYLISRQGAKGQGRRLCRSSCP